MVRSKVVRFRRERWLMGFYTDEFGRRRPITKSVKVLEVPAEMLAAFHAFTLYEKLRKEYEREEYEEYLQRLPSTKFKKMAEKCPYYWIGACKHSLNRRDRFGFVELAECQMESCPIGSYPRHCLIEVLRKFLINQKLS